MFFLIDFWAKTRPSPAFAPPVVLVYREAKKKDLPAVPLTLTF